jgi:hypothetical protein
MDMSRTLISITVCLLLLSFCLEARAEVSARTDRRGNYVTTQVIPVGLGGDRHIWSIRRAGLRLNSALNPAGDAYGDLWPTIAESPSAPYHPLVVWSRFNGIDYDLAWSRWSEQGWEPVRWLADFTMPGDDLDADLAFGPGGRPYMVWWSESDAPARVFLSFYIAERWIAPIAISDAEVDSRYPTVEVEDAGLLKVLYETPEGTVTRFVAFGNPDTITDDINPQSCVYVNMSSALVIIP